MSDIAELMQTAFKTIAAVAEYKAEKEAEIRQLKDEVDRFRSLAAEREIERNNALAEVERLKMDLAWSGKSCDKVYREDIL